ncbi:MAG: insulinase family protein [Bacteroidota bacterium]
MFSRSLIGMLAGLMLGPLLYAQGQPESVDKIPLNPDVRSGVLPNGMKYYVQKNQEPENRMELRLAVNAGSILEDDDQQGLAHFVEHMAFNGSANFEKNELIDFLESAGVKFGPHLNAYTSFEETVYMIQVATDDPKIVDKGLLILEDWATGIAFDHKEIDKERGVVIEEWRLRSGADSRMRDRYLPVMVNGSHYADRLPIGKVEILKNFEYETIKRFYKKWYRPELMSVIAVGDFDPAEMEKKIVAQFGEIPASAEPIARPSFDIPGHEEILTAVETDPEAGFCSMQLLYKHEYDPVVTKADYRQSLVEAVTSLMLTARIEEVQQKGDSPLMFGGTFDGPIGGFRNKAAFMAIGVMNPTDPVKGATQVLTEVERARRHGFLATELERAKEKLASQIETRYNDRNKTESRQLAMKLVAYYLTNQPYPGIAWSYKESKEIMPTITLEETNALIKTRITEENSVLVMTGPEKEGVTMPSKEELLALYRDIKKQTIDPYKEEIDDRPLVESPPAAGEITAEKSVDALNLTEWTLANGARIVLRPTDFKDDEIMMYAYSPGGLSRLSDSEFEKAWALDGVIENSGVGRFKKSVLDKKLAGKVVQVAPWIGELYEGLRGGCAPKDLETMLQLVHLYFTAPRQDKDGFNSYKQMLEGFANMSASPEGAFRDSLSVLMSQDHPRRQPMTKERIGELSNSQILMSYLDRFMNPSDFTFVIVGNFVPEEIKPYITQYIGGIDGGKRKESWKDRGIKAPEGIVERSFRKGTDPKSMVNLAFTGGMDFNLQNEFDLQAMVSVLKIMLRESLREDKGGVYGVRVSARAKKHPAPGYRIDISFTCAPERVDELVETAMDEIRSLRDNGPSAKNLQKVQEIERRSYETDMKDNRFWMNQLVQHYQLDIDPIEMLNYLALVDGVNDQTVKLAAEQYLDLDNYIQLVMYPEEGDE